MITTLSGKSPLGGFRGPILLTMKNITKIFPVLLILSFSACSLDKDPLSEFVIGTASGEDLVKYETRDEMYAKYQDIYKQLAERQEHWYLDYLLINEVRSDNAYAGTTGSEVVPMETNAIGPANSNLARDWNRYLEDVALANVIIHNVDKVPDLSLTDAERKQWKAEAKIFRAMIWFDMVRIWGDIPVIIYEAEDITAENIEEIFQVYYPPQVKEIDVYAQIIEDLKAGIEDAPNKSAADKTILSKSVAKALLAKVYAEKPVRDYNKVIEYCDAVLADGFELVSNFEDLFGMNDALTEPKARSTSESILEVNYYTGNGNWVTWMFGRNLTNWNESFTWAKWITPSRDLIKAYEDEGDQVRYSQSIVFYECEWSNYYPSNNYAFMYKCRSAVSSIIKLRSADIILLKAEALAHNGDLSGAAALVNKIRTRVGLANLKASASTSQSAMLDAILHERRLELALEGHRWFDLVRYEKVEEVMNSINSRDEGRLAQRKTFDETSYRFPIPSTVMDQNSNLVQNPGY